MSKNIFNVLAMEDSDDEGQQVMQKENKKQRREKDQNLRETHGDHVQKDNSNRFDERKQQTQRSYQNPSKREFDRKSGTGRQAQGGGYRKRGGFGKGNVAKGMEREEEEATQEQQKQETEVNNENEPEEPKEEKPQMKTLDEYMNDKSDKFSYLNKFKKSDEAEKEAKGKAKRKGNNVVIDTESFRGQDRRNRGKKNKRGNKKQLNMDDNDFPSL